MSSACVLGRPAVVRQAAAFVDRIVLETNPAVQACRRMRTSG